MCCLCRSQRRAESATRRADDGAARYFPECGQHVLLGCQLPGGENVITAWKPHVFAYGNVMGTCIRVEEGAFLLHLRVACHSWTAQSP